MLEIISFVSETDYAVLKRMTNRKLQNLVRHTGAPGTAAVFM